MEEKTLETIFNRIIKTSQIENKKNLAEKVLKLQEEVGELAKEVLKKTGYVKTNSNKTEIQNNILEEAVDCYIMVLDILSSEGFTSNEIIEKSNKKIDKWLSNI